MNLNGKKVDTKSIEVYVERNDYPDFSDSYIETAYFEDGTELTDEQIERLEYEYGDDIWQLFYESYLF